MILWPCQTSPLILSIRRIFNRTFFQIPQTRFTRQCNMTAGQFPCLVKGCYTAEDICNGRPDCEDGFDESNCYDFAEWQQEQTLKFRLSRYELVKPEHFNAIFIQSILTLVNLILSNCFQVQSIQRLLR